MERGEIEFVLTKQKKYFASGQTLPINARKDALRKLLDAMERYESDLSEALKQDLGKNCSGFHLSNKVLVYKSCILLCQRAVEGEKIRF